jgi:protein-glucosylgalactosylhydroxylysine glucosidase
MKKRFITLVFSLFTMAAFAQSLADSPWHIVADKIDPNNYYGITVANGMIGLVSSAEPLKFKEVVLNGTFDTYGRGRVSNILKVFNFADMYVEIDNKYRIDKNNIINFRQTLDMKKGVLLTEFDTKDGAASFRYSVMALRHLPYSVMTTLEVTAKKDLKVDAANTMQAPDVLRDVKNFYSVIDRPHVKIPLMTSVAKSPTGKHTIAASCSYLFDGDAHSSPEPLHEDWDYNMHLVRFGKRLKAGETFKMSIVGSICSTEQYTDPHNEAERLTVYAALEGQARLQKRHDAAWEEMWQSDIQIEGDLEAQKGVRSALYHLYSFVREGTAYSPSPMGLSGLGYNGHAFWDTELWMYPPLLMLKPELAKGILEYRFQRLKMAKQNAFSHGYKGAMFPWESDDAGQEATPVWALTGPFEHHVTACVGFAFWKYYQTTKDKVWLAERGYPMLKEVADFWVSRVETGSDGKLHINNVVGADEWAENINDNAFTNGAAISALQYAVAAAKDLGLVPNPVWQATADKINLLKFPDGTIQEYEGYNGTEIKQADAILLAYPLKIVSTEADIRKNMAYYEGRTSPTGPAMNSSVYTVLYSRLQDPENAYRLFVKSYKFNELPPFGVLAETAGGTNPYFATGAGGMLQGVLAGIGGLDITDTGIVQLKTKLPSKWKSLTITGVGKEKKTFTLK